MEIELFRKFAASVQKDKKLKIVIIIGLIGILLIGASELFPQSEKSQKQDEDFYADYIETLEKKTCDIVSSIEGVGNCKVMLTLSSSSENVYAKNSQENTESGHYSRQNEYVLYDDDSGEAPLLLQENFPQVMGVAVVCSGGDSVQVREKVVQCLAALYHLSANRISVSKLRN